MRLSDLMLFPEQEIQIDDTLALTPYSAPDTDDPEIQRWLELMVAANTENEVRLIFKLIFDAWARGELEVDALALSELNRLGGRPERFNIPF